LIEAGYRCSIPRCTVDSALEFHHIDGDTTNNDASNLLVVCSNHHTACTRGQIDRKACRDIKQYVEPQEVRARGTSVSVARLRRVLREERASGTNARATTTTGFRSPLDRAHLLKVLARPLAQPYEAYMAMRVLGSMRYRGSTRQLIEALGQLERNRRRSRVPPFRAYYQAAVQSLAQIGTRDALRWLADEFEKPAHDGFTRFMLYMAIASCRTAPKHLGFRILDRGVTKIEAGTPSQTLFRMRGEKYKLILEVTPEANA